MGQTRRTDVNPVERQERLAKQGKLPARGGSRRSSTVRAIADDLREAAEMDMYDDDMPYLEDLDDCGHPYPCDCITIDLEMAGQDA